MRADNPDQQPDPIPEDAWGPGYRFWKSIQSLLAQRGPEGTTSLVRMASHFVILLVAVAVLLISRLGVAALGDCRGEAGRRTLARGRIGPADR